MNESKLNTLKKYTLLLVDDEVGLLDKLSTILSLFFENVVLAKDGQEALNIYRTQKVDMIISDYSMPVMSGYELCKSIRKEDKRIPLVIMSNYSDKEKLLNSIPLSLAQYLIKPLEYATITQTLLRMIEQLEVHTSDSIKMSESLSYNMFTKKLTENEETISLSNSEITIIELFIMNKNKILTMEQINLCLDPVEQKSKPAIKSLIYRVRKKIGKEVILNIPSYGYMFKVEEGT